MLKSLWITGLLCSIAAILAITDANETVFITLNQGGAHAKTFWARLTYLGDTIPLLVLIGLFAWKKPEILWAGLIATLVVGLGIQAIKHIVSLPRPAAVLPSELIHIVGSTLKSRAFPSGHSAAAFAMAALIMQTLRTGSASFLLILVASLIALSRVIVGAHWPIDVLVGAGLGWTLGTLSVRIAHAFPWGFATPTGRKLCAGFFSLSAVLSIGHDGGYSASRPLPDLITVAGLAVILPYFLYQIGLTPPRYYFVLGDHLRKLSARSYL